MDKKLNVIIAGGGTGGHLFPALAIGQGLKSTQADIRVHFIGSAFGIEAGQFTKENVSFSLLPVRGLQRGFGLSALGRNLLLPGRLIRSLAMTKKIFSEFKPDIVIGTGGYASAIPLRVAIKNKIRVLIQEQNSYPGMTTRWFAGQAAKVCIAYEETEEYLKKKTSFLPGIRCGRIFVMATA